MAGLPSSFKYIPFVGMSFEDGQANVSSGPLPLNALIIGQKTSAGTGSEATKYSITKASEVRDLAGPTSMAYEQATCWFKNCKTIPTTLIMLDDATGTQATTTITLGGTATEVGSFPLHIKGHDFYVPVAVGDDPDDVGPLLVTAINAIDQSGVASYLTNVVTYTASQDGVLASDVDIRNLYYSTDKIPAGLTCVIAATTPGTVDPEMSTALDVIGDEWFNIIICPYTSVAATLALQTFADDQNAATIQRDCMIFNANRDTYANLITYGLDTTNHNSEFVSCLAAYKRLESVWQLGAAVAGAYATSLQSDIGQPLHRVKVKGIKPLNKNDVFDLTSERNNLANSGIATLSDSIGVQTEATVTMFQKNSAGATDYTYRSINSMFIWMYLRYSLVQRFNLKYPRARLAQSADKMESGIVCLTPKRATGEMQDWFSTQVSKGLLEDNEEIRAGLYAEIDDDDKNRLNFIVPTDLVNQFITGSGQMQRNL